MDYVCDNIDLNNVDYTGVSLVTTIALNLSSSDIVSSVYANPFEDEAIVNLEEGCTTQTVS